VLFNLGELWKSAWEGCTVLTGVIDIYTRVVNTYDILKVKNALVMPVQYAMDFADTTFNLIVYNFDEG
jgi:hypothetical protein